MIEKKEIANEKTILIGTIKPGETDELIHEHLGELELLAETAGAEVIGKITQRISKINSATFIGKGKSMQIINQAIELNAKLIIFDDELSPAQIKNYHNLSDKIKVLDRSGLILDIFRKHARTKEATTQVDLAPRVFTSKTHKTMDSSGASNGWNWHKSWDGRNSN